MNDDVGRLAFDDADREDDRGGISADDHREAVVQVEGTHGIAVCVEDVHFAHTVLKGGRRDDKFSQLVNLFRGMLASPLLHHDRSSRHHPSVVDVDHLAGDVELGFIVDQGDACSAARTAVSRSAIPHDPHSAVAVGPSERAARRTRPASVGLRSTGTRRRDAGLREGACTRPGPALLRDSASRVAQVPTTPGLDAGREPLRHRGFRMRATALVSDQVGGDQRHTADLVGRVPAPPGHSTANLTLDIYGHLMGTDADRASIDRLNSVFGEPRERQPSSEGSSWQPPSELITLLGRR